MSEGGADHGSSPKLYNHKPKISQLKQFQGQKSNEFSSPSSMGAQTAPPPPPPLPKEPFIKRYKFVFPVLLAGVGVYLALRTNTKKKETVDDEKDATPVSIKDTTAPVVKTSVSPPLTANTVIKREPIPEGQQRELFKWILEEKRKIKPKDSEEKQRIDEEKALLKNLIRSKSIPSI